MRDVTDPIEARRTGDGGSSDGDDQPEDTGARTSSRADERTGKEQAEENRAKDPPG
jgi:hypothetical protein